MGEPKRVDDAKVEAVADQIFTNLSHAALAPMIVLGDRLGLLRSLASGGPATSEEFASRTGMQERYVREWLSALTCASLVEYEPAGARFSLSPEAEAVLVDATSPWYLGGMYRELLPLYSVVPRIATAFREGGGVPFEAYEPAFWSGLESETAPLFDHQLVQSWIPEVPGLVPALERGIDVADVGCGAGLALINLALAFPAGRYTGFDFLSNQLERARDHARGAGVADRVSFELLDGIGGLPSSYDLITTFDVVHDTRDPMAFLRSIRTALRDDGVYLMLEFTSADTLEGNIGLLGSFLYSSSVLYCMTTSLAQGGVGLGTAGLPESKVRELTKAAGFASARRVPTPSPINSLYEIRP